MKDLKIKIQIGDQPVMVWNIIKKDDKYTCFKASISAGKKQLDGSWINKSQNFSCFVYGEVKEKFDREVIPQKRISQVFWVFIQRIIFIYMRKKAFEKIICSIYRGSIFLQYNIGYILIFFINSECWKKKFIIFQKFYKIIGKFLKKDIINENRKLNFTKFYLFLLDLILIRNLIV